MREGKLRVELCMDKCLVSWLETHADIPRKTNDFTSVSLVMETVFGELL